MTLPTRRCMVCRNDLLKGFYKHRTDPICIQCTQNVKEQRRLLTEKYKQQYHERLLHAQKVAREKKRKGAAA